MRTIGTVSIAATAIVFLAAPAWAQAPWSGSGELTDNDSVGDGQHRYDDHPIRLEAGQRYRIAVNSEAFDPVARLYRAGEREPVAENDDSSGLNPRISYAPAASGDFVLRVTAFAAEGRGAYTAGVAALPPLPPGAAVPWSVSGRIDDGDSADDDSEAHRYDEHVLRLEAGRRYRISVSSDAFDTVARLYRPGTEEQVAENDDSGGTLNSLISYRPGESGDYVLRVSPLAGNGRGAYRAAAAIAPPWPAPLTLFRRMEATIWRVYVGELTAADADNGGARFDDYLVHFGAGQERTITLDATGAEPFDTVVQVYRAADREGEALASNDDSGGTLNSMLVYKAEQAGDYIVRATALGAGGLGAYRLRVSE
jgi:stress-induced morphogen